MSTSLPPEVMVEIVSRLPPKYLLRFRCVSKTWLAVIDGNHYLFSKNLLNQSILNTQNTTYPLPLILVKATDKSNSEESVFYSLSYDTLDCLSQIPMKFPPENLPLGRVHLFIRPHFASSNGLLCLYDFETTRVYIWNPATPSVGLKALPPLSPHPFHYEIDLRPFSVGFGFCRKSGDFKVVSLRHVANDNGYGMAKQIAEVYSSSSGCWGLLNLRVPCAVFAHPQTLALDGVFLWLAEQDDGVIISFDFTKDVFRTTPLPYSRDLLSFSHQLMGLNGYVAVAVFPHADTNIKMSLEIWVLLEIGVKESWRRFISIEPPMDLERPLGFWKNGELFMLNREGQLVLYDPFTQTKNHLQIKWLKDSFQVVVLYTQTSVELGGEYNL
ncbi:F-box/kelch-repeat protein At3g23880-like [Alnus glutinosa]|uniref:F-box/kelch-repeat protein At3g23880-like n=1 Tax=Alnus glutinosa TaxID=3517 RepID=UPI002D797B43|nr:F-box/kelch-repeat protein At3g23880-like [Alnus glutinosa]